MIEFDCPECGTWHQLDEKEALYRITISCGWCNAAIIISEAVKAAAETKEQR